MQIDQNIPKKTFSLSSILEYFKTTSTRPSPELQDRRERCIPIIQKLPNNRTKEEENLLLSVLKQYNFLENASHNEGKEDKVLSKISQILEYEVIPAGTAICHKGESGNKFYLILRGKAVAYSEISQEPQDTQETSIKSFRGLLNSSQINQDSDSFSRRSFLLQDESQKSIKKGRPNIFQHKIIKRDLNKIVGQGNLRSGAKKFTRENLPQTVWDVDRVLAFMDVSYKPRLLNMTNDNSREMDEKYVEMLFEYKLLEVISGEMPGRYIKDGHFLYKATKKLKEGDFFGEHTLISNKPRNATVIASQDLHCLTISKKDYQYVSAKKVEAMNSNLKFLQGLFPDSAKGAIGKLAQLFEEHHYGYNQVIFEEETQPDGFYFIKEGKVQLIKRMISKGEQLSSSLERKQSKKNIVTVLGEGEVLGEEDVFMQRNRESSAIVSSKEAVLLKIDKKIYDNLNESFKGIFSGLGKVNKGKSKSQSRGEGKLLVETQSSKKVNLNWSGCQESPSTNNYDIFSRFSGLMEMSSAKVARQSTLDDHNMHHHKQASLTTNSLGVSTLKRAPSSTTADKLAGNSKKFFKKIFYQEEIQKNKSQIEQPESPLSKTVCPFEAESKPYSLRINTDIEAPTPDLPDVPDVNSSMALSETPNDYMLIKAPNLSKGPNKGLQKKQGTLRKIIEFRLNIQPLQTQPNSRKDTRGTAVTQTNASINVSQDESSGQKEPENNSFLNLKKSWRPPTTGGYYSVYRDMIAGQRAPLNQVSPTANITLLSRVHAMRTTRERTPFCDAAGISSARMTSSQVDKRKSNLLKPRPSPREDVSEENTSNSRIGKTFSEYFRGFHESGEASGRKTGGVTTRVPIVVSKSVMKMRTTGDYFKKRENVGNKSGVSGEKLLTLQTLLIKPS